MSENDVYSEIESVEFAARLTIAGNVEIFLRAAARLQVTRQLMLLSTTSADDIVGRIRELISQSVEGDYRHPGDVAVAIYLWVVASIHEPTAILLAKSIRDDTRECWWWAAKMSSKLLAGRQECTLSSRSKMASVVYDGDKFVEDWGGTIANGKESLGVTSMSTLYSSSTESRQSLKYI